MKAGAQFQQSADTPLDVDLAAGRTQNAGCQLENGAFTAAVAPDDTEALPPHDREGDVVYRL